MRDYQNSICLVAYAQGFSRMSEQLSPVALAELVQEYFQAIITLVRKKLREGPNQFLIQYLSGPGAEQKMMVLNEGVIFLTEK